MKQKVLILFLWAFAQGGISLGQNAPDEQTPWYNPIGTVESAVSNQQSFPHTSGKFYLGIGNANLSTAERTRPVYQIDFSAPLAFQHGNLRLEASGTFLREIIEEGPSINFCNLYPELCPSCPPQGLSCPNWRLDRNTLILTLGAGWQVNLGKWQMGFYGRGGVAANPGVDLTQSDTVITIGDVQLPETFRMRASFRPTLAGGVRIAYRIGDDFSLFGDLSYHRIFSQPVALQHIQEAPTFRIFTEPVNQTMLKATIGLALHL